MDLSVQYKRPNYALQTLVAELRQVLGEPRRVPEFVTGYKSASNVTGHNPDNNGVVHGVDLFFSGSGDQGWTEDNGIKLAEWLRQVEIPRGQIPGQPQRAWYIIYRDHLAGPMTGYHWSKRPDGSGYQHWDHIHISTTDIHWGAHTALPAADYDSRAPWGAGQGALTGAANQIEIIDEDDMPLTQEDVNRIASAVVSYQVDKAGPGQSGKINLGAMLAWYDANNAAVIGGAANEVLNRQLPWAGFDGTGKAGNRTTTSLGLQAGWLDTQHTSLANAVAALTELVRQLSVKQGVTIDYQAIANAVNDDAAARMQGRDTDG